MTPDRDKEIAELTRQVEQLKQTLGTLIAWICQSANSPIRMDEGFKLMNILEGRE